jgi:hypothetical protein
MLSAHVRMYERMQRDLDVARRWVRCQHTRYSRDDGTHARVQQSEIRNPINCSRALRFMLPVCGLESQFILFAGAIGKHPCSVSDF